MRAGKHLLVEKPLTTRWEQALALAEAARAAPEVTVMALPYVDAPPFLRALDFARESYLGKITGVEAELSFPGPPRSNWYYSASAEGGAMLDTMVYPLARVAALMGPARRVTALVNRLIPHRITGDGGRVESAVDDSVSILLEYPTGQQAQLHSVWARSYMTNGTVLHGRHGAIFLSRYGQPLVVKSDLQAPPDGTPLEYLGIPNCYQVPVPQGTVEGEIVAHFLRAVRKEAPLHCGLDVGLHIAEQQMMAYEFARSGQGDRPDHHLRRVVAARAGDHGPLSGLAVARWPAAASAPASSTAPPCGRAGGRLFTLAMFLLLTLALLGHLSLLLGDIGSAAPSSSAASASAPCGAFPPCWCSGASTAASGSPPGCWPAPSSGGR